MFIIPSQRFYIKYHHTGYVNRGGDKRQPTVLLLVTYNFTAATKSTRLSVPWNMKDEGKVVCNDR
jgi:hypothetical protein